jgi:replicative DNA helicase
MENVKDITFSPQAASRLSLDMVDKLRQDPGGGIKSGISDLDKILLPFRPGELVTVMGYTSNYKSGFMNWLSKQAIKAIEPESNETVIRVTWEQSVEEDTISWLAGASDLSITRLARGLVDEKEWKRLQTNAVERAVTPMWIIGHSQQESKDRKKTRPRMTMPDVSLAIEYICNDASVTKLSPKMIVLDYLQRIRPAEEDGFTKREQMLEAVNHAKDMAISFGCPVVLGVQTGRQVMDRQMKLPSIEDGQETSNIEQSSDKMFSLWYPIKTEDAGSLIGGEEVNKNLLILRLLKQKLGEAPATFALYVDPEKNIIGDRARLKVI